MKYLKFYVDTEDVKKKLVEKEKIKDIRIIDSSVDTDGKAVEFTCLIESEDDNIGEASSYCYRSKIII